MDPVDDKQSCIVKCTQDTKLETRRVLSNFVKDEEIFEVECRCDTVMLLVELTDEQRSLLQERGIDISIDQATIGDDEEDFL